MHGKAGSAVRRSNITSFVLRRQVGTTTLSFNASVNGRYQNANKTPNKMDGGTNGKTGEHTMMRFEDIL